MARTALALGAALIVAGGGALGFALTRKADAAAAMTTAQDEAARGAIGQLDGDIKAVRAAVEGRARTLADFDRVRAVIGSDRQTAADMATGGGVELQFRTEPGETLELVQKAAGAAAVDPLLVLPAGAVRSPHSGVAGGFVELVRDRIVVTHTSEVKPTSSDAIDKFTAFVTVSRVLDPKPALARLTDAGIAGKLQIGATSLAIGTPTGAATEARPLPSVEGARLEVEMAEAARASQLPIVGAAAGAAGLGLILLIAGMVAGRKPARATPYIQTVPTVESVPPAEPRGAQTKLTGPGVAAGTPSPVEPSASASINPSNLGAGAMIGRWEVIRRLGSGGMADVYLAHSKGEAGFEKLVAIKVMHSHLARNPRAVDHFLDEARLAARIHHPNVVAIQDLGKIGNDYVIVMEYVEGVDLERLLASARDAQRTVPIEVGLGILCRICDGLNAAHTAVGPDGSPLGIIHRDVKSANVLVSRQGGVKVVDFGIAKATAQSHLTIAGETKGTPSMMAPEQRVGERVDVRADVYSVAAVGYEVVTGHGVNLDLAALAHLGVDNWPHLPPPSTLRPNLPGELDDMLLTAMAFERDRRPADCAAFGAMLEAVMKQHGLTASDKDIARWVDGELRQLLPAYEGAVGLISKPIGA